MCFVRPHSAWREGDCDVAIEWLLIRNSTSYVIVSDYHVRLPYELCMGYSAVRAVAVLELLYSKWMVTFHLLTCQFSLLPRLSQVWE